jgi:hypothetical protein
MRADFTPPPPDRSKDPGYFDVTELTMPDPEQVKQVRREINQLHHKGEQS